MGSRKRRRLQGSVVTKVLRLCRRRCCICFCLENNDKAKTDGQIAHLDKNPENSDPENLAYLCLRHHNLYDSSSSQSKGLTPGEVKFYRDQLVRHLSKYSGDQTASSAISRDRIRMTDTARSDCRLLHVRKDKVVDFVVGEAERHPILFTSPFSSVPLLFYEHVVLISWDCLLATIERLLSRQQAYPLNDLWSSCLSTYRQTTLLPYRQQGPGQLAYSSEAQRTVSVFRNLVDTMHEFLNRIKDDLHQSMEPYTHLQYLLVEAEFAITNNDTGNATARFEAILSTIHKLLLKYAPQGITVASRKPVDTPKLPKYEEDKPSILIVDDSMSELYALREIFENCEFNVVTASTPQEAMRVLVERQFDVVLTDMRMLAAEGGGLDGREVAIAAKKACPAAKIIILTAYFVSTLMAEVPCDLALSKLDFDPCFAERIREMLKGFYPVKSRGRSKKC